MANGGIAAAAEQPVASGNVVRSMVFTVDVSRRTEEAVKTSGLFGGTDPMSGGGGFAAGGAATIRQQTADTAAGTIAVDVVAIVPDGLVVDVVDDAAGHPGRRIRIGVTTKGKLVYDAGKTPLSEEAILLLQLVNRALVEGHDADGVTWTDDLTERNLKDVTRYRVVSSTEATPGPILPVDLQRTVSWTGTNAFEMTEFGKFDYNERRAVPLSATLRERRTGTKPSGQNVVTETVYTYRLSSDTGVKR